MIHEKAIIDPGASIGAHVSIGPYTIIGPGCQVGDNTIIDSHVVIEKNCTIGENNRIYSHASLGGDPQDLKYKGEESYCIIGDENIIREYVTINRGTKEGGGKTVIGNRNLLMAYCHVAHDCIIDDEVIMANCATLGGHVEVHEGAVIGGLTGIHQFVRIGANSIVGAMSAVPKDIPPYVTANPTRGGKKTIFGLNNVGLRRKGVPKKKIEELKDALKLVVDIETKVDDMVKLLKDKYPESEEITYLIEFFISSKRGVERI